MTSPAIFSTTRRVEFSDTDAAGVAHFTRLLAFVEEAEHALFRAASVESLEIGVGWPRTAVEVRFTSPARFGDLLRTEIGSLAFSGPLLSYKFVVQRSDGSSGMNPQSSPGRPVLAGTMSVCRVLRSESGNFTPSDIPEGDRKNLLAIAPPLDSSTPN